MSTLKRKLADKPAPPGPSRVPRVSARLLKQKAAPVESDSEEPSESSEDSDGNRYSDSSETRWKDLDLQKELDHGRIMHHCEKYKSDPEKYLEEMYERAKEGKGWTPFDVGPFLEDPHKDVLEEYLEEFTLPDAWLYECDKEGKEENLIEVYEVGEEEEVVDKINEWFKLQPTKVVVQRDRPPAGRLQKDLVPYLKNLMDCL
jgi:hypothetical protein